MTTIAEAPLPVRRSTRRPILLGAATLALAAAFLAGYLPRRAARARVVAATATAPVAVRFPVVKAAAVDSGHVLTLPAGLVPAQQTLVYARASGYVRRWLVDIGDRVERGQLLVELDTPELDQELAQARASLEQAVAALGQAQANQAYAHITERRQADLVAKSLIAAQDYDQARTQAAVSDANVGAAKANVAAQRAHVAQLAQLVSFGKVDAPFAGTITRRLVDIGTLVNGGGGSSATALFEIAATDPMLAYVDVPQVYAPSVRVGAEAKVTVKNFSGRAFVGRVTRTAGALDPASRTLRTEVALPNRPGELLAGMFVQVSLDVAVSHQVVRVPSSAIIADARGVHVAVVDGTGGVHLTAVTVGPDNGNTVDLVAGLSGGEQVIATPPSDVADGMRVQVASAS
jgi:membrane fusion protein (multidrug efflux system)